MQGAAVRRELELLLSNGRFQASKQLLNECTKHSNIDRIRLVLDFMAAGGSMVHMIRLISAYSLWPDFVKLFCFDCALPMQPGLLAGLQIVHTEMVTFLASVPEGTNLLLSTLATTMPWVYLALATWKNPRVLFNAINAKCVHVLASRMHVGPDGRFSVKIMQIMKEQGHELWPMARKLLICALCLDTIPEKTVNEVFLSGILKGERYIHPKAIVALRSVPDLDSSHFAGIKYATAGWGV